MAAKEKTVYQCTACGATFPKWAGQCVDCGAWNSLEEVQATVSTAKASRPAGYAGESSVARLDQIELTETSRLPTGLKELDRVLGGGLVSGSVVLIGGDPGIGKSTLLLQALASLSERSEALYITGEESLQQVAVRAQRLNLAVEKLEVLAETCVERVIALAKQRKPQLLVIDSIQTVFTESLSSAPGTVSQLREAAAQLVRFAKQSNTALFIVGHVTKEGAIAGPRVLEHMVDTVLYFESEAGSRFRVIRSVKNRFGAVNEIGIFAMADNGLREVSNPSAIFLSRHTQPVSGSVIMVTREGTRPLLVELQALVDESHSSQPKRVTLGLEQNRLTMLLAVLHRHVGIAMFDQDVFCNVVGGVRVAETAADLPLLLAAMSSMRDRALPTDLVVFGEVGLAGEVRPVPAGEERVAAAAKHGFKVVLAPKANIPKKPPNGIECVPIERLSDAMDWFGR